MKKPKAVKNYYEFLKTYMPKQWAEEFPNDARKEELEIISKRITKTIIKTLG